MKIFVRTTDEIMRMMDLKISISVKETGGHTDKNNKDQETRSHNSWNNDNNLYQNNRQKERPQNASARTQKESLQERGKYFKYFLLYNFANNEKIDSFYDG